MMITTIHLIFGMAMWLRRDWSSRRLRNWRHECAEHILLYFAIFWSVKFEQVPARAGEPGGSHPSRRPHSAIPGPCASPSATAVLHGSVNGWRCMLRPSVPGWMHREGPPGHASRAWWCKAGAGADEPMIFLEIFGGIEGFMLVELDGIGGIQARFLKQTG